MARKRIEVKNPVLLAGAHYLNSGFGERTVNGKKGFHNGVDLVGGTDASAATDYITAFEAGIVTRAVNDVEGKTPSEGNCVVINHGNGFTTSYFHLKKGSVRVKVGECVARGEVIAYMGNTGNSTGAHLHFGMKLDGAWVDPLPYLLGEKSLGIKRVSITVKALRRGDKGADVLVMQTLLSTLYGASIESDGSFGGATERAVRKFQKDHDLAVDGVCGGATWSALLRT